MESRLNCLRQLLATELVHMPLVKRQAKQIELTIFVNRKLDEPSGLWPRFSTQPQIWLWASAQWYHARPRRSICRV